MDQAITQWINSFAGHTPWADALMLGATRAGVPVMVAYVVLQWWARAGRPRVRHACASAGLSFLLGEGLNQIVLLFVHRPRPYDAGVSHLIIAPSPDWSFPSDHATAALAILFAFLLARQGRRALVVGVLAFLVCLSRIYVGTHYVSDVLGGGLTGLAAAILVRWTYRAGSGPDRFVTGIL
ncbi:MAG: phosphatase PAP2 family protein [Proteobacteria bacterium]|nr:phosphatase PAP2 family protein [Pseudomonadota bacterium]MBS0573595.1 phosphatase PAP2 family protein [Pseudomonadota bacterium]